MNLNYDSEQRDSIEIFISWSDAYNYTKNKCFVNQTKIEQMIGVSSFATQLYKFVRKNEMVYNGVHIRKYPKDIFATKKCLLEVKKVCIKYNAKLIISIIPDESDMEKMNFKKLELKLKNELSPEIDYKLIRTLTKTDYAPEEYDTHFNNSGHLKYSIFLKSLIY